MKSELPASRILSASSGVRMRPATITGMFTACLIGRAYGSRHLRGIDGGWMQKRDSSGLSLLPPDRSSAATPARSKACASAITSSVL